MREYGEAKDLIPKQRAINEAHQAMKDYRDDHSPDIALLLTVARIVKSHLKWECDGLMRKGMLVALDDAMKPFEQYPNPVESFVEGSGEETQA